MNFEESMGEPSSKRQENGDESTGSERPLKKARFAWQVKGKHHLRNESNDSSSSNSTNPAHKPGTSSPASRSHNTLGNTEQNLEILGDYLLKQDFNTLDSVIADSDKSLLKPVSMERLDYPRYISSFERNGLRTYTGRNDSETMVPMSMVTNQSYNEDQYIARWQARQIAKGFVDNTINRVLDSWMIAPIPADVDDNRNLALDVAEFINNLPGDNSIENEGILMAISAHGLQNKSNSCDSHHDDRDCYSSRKSESYRSRSSSPLQTDDDDNDLKFNEEKPESNHDKTFNHLAWTHEDESEMNNPHAPFSLFPQTSPLHFDNDNGNSSIDFDDSSPSSDTLTSHYDFMDAAVSYAIQNKGLASFGSDYSWITE